MRLDMAQSRRLQNQYSTNLKILLICLVWLESMSLLLHGSSSLIHYKKLREDCKILINTKFLPLYVESRETKPLYRLSRISLILFLRR